MNRIIVTGVSMLALGITPSLAQESNPPKTDAVSPQCTCPDTGAVNSTTGSQDQSSNLVGGPTTRDATGDRPVQPGASANLGADTQQEGREIPFPPQDVSDNDLEPLGREYPSGYPDGSSDSASAAGSQDSDDLFEEGETVPEGVRRYQGPDMWESDDGPKDVDSDEGPSTLAEKRNEDGSGDGLSAEQGAAGAWDGRGASRRFDRGDLHPEPQDRRDAEGLQSGAQADAGNRLNKERRLQLARTALRTARATMPNVRFRTYEFEREGDARVIEIAGVDADSDRRVEVDVGRNGRVRSISEAIPLDAVPDDVRTAVRNELGRFRVGHSMRSIRRDLDLYYEFAGVTQSGRKATVEIRADGRDMSVRYHDRG